MKAHRTYSHFGLGSFALAATTLLACSSEGIDGANTEERGEVEARSDELAVAAPPINSKLEAYQAYLARRSASTSGAVAQRAAVENAGDTMVEYAAKCDIATGVHVPGFSCKDGTEVPGQEDAGVVNAGGSEGLIRSCNKPNVLNDRCDPGSKFQVLVRTADAVVVAHCRKVKQPEPGTLYDDVAVIQYNKKNGAQCFYQALTGAQGQDAGVQGENVPAPSSGAQPWIDPAGTEAIGCTGCHDNGGLIRSPYLAQLTTGKDAFPTTSTGFDNLTIPVKYVGLDYALNRSWSITGPTVVGSGAACNSCHRLAVSNYFAFKRINGTAGHFADQATAQAQSIAKRPHGTMSPIWMRPGQITYVASANASAVKFQDCANGFWRNQNTNGGFQNGTPTSGCNFTPLATSWDGIDPAQAVTALTSL
jgi:hypothetical protein